VYVCGLALEGAVAFTALHALELGFVTHVVDDACCGASLRQIEQRTHELHSAGVRLVHAVNVPSLVHPERASLDDAIDAARHARRARAVASRLTLAPAHGVPTERAAPTHQLSDIIPSGYRTSLVHAHGGRAGSSRSLFSTRAAAAAESSVTSPLLPSHGYASLPITSSQKMISVAPSSRRSRLLSRATSRARDRGTDGDATAEVEVERVPAAASIRTQSRKRESAAGPFGIFLPRRSGSSGDGPYELTRTTSTPVSSQI